MVVSLDAVAPSSSGQSYTGSTSTSWSHTVGAGSNSLVVVGVTVGGSTSGTTTSATFGGTSMTSLAKRYSNDQTDGYVEVLYLIGPASGTATVAVTFGGGGTPDGLVGGSLSFFGVDQTTPLSSTTAVGAVDTSTHADPSISLSVASGNYGLAIVGDGQTLTAPTQTSAWSNARNFSSAAGSGGAQYAAGTGGALTYGWTATADWWAVVAAEVLAVSSNNWTRSSTDDAGATDQTPRVARFGDSLTWTVGIT